MELPTVKPAELKCSRDVSLEISNEMIYKLPGCRSDRSHKTELNKQIHLVLKGLHMWVSISCVAIHNRFLKVVFVVIIYSIFANLLCRTGKGIAAEHIVRQPSLLSWGFCTCILPRRKRNCRWTTARVSLLGQINFLNGSQLKNSFCRYQNWRK